MMLIAWLRIGKSDIGLTMRGVLARLVVITAPRVFGSPLSAIMFGIVGGVVAVYGVSFLDKVKVDDPVGAVPVHGFSGVWR